MKIAIIGQDFEQKKKIIEKFLQLSGTYGTLKETIHDEEITVKDDLKLNEEWNELEIELYQRMSFVTDLMDKYTDKTNVVFNGHSLDILAETMALYGMEEVSEEFVEKMIYWNRKLMQKLDLIYWLASPEKIIELKDDEEVEYEKFYEHQLEVVYNNIWNDYTTRFEVSEILPRDCPGMAFFETDTPAAEMFEIVHDLDTVDDKTARMDDIAKLDKIIKDKKLLDQMKNALMETTIPLPSGERVSSGGISLDKPL
jgi:hypothetical protein